MATSPNTPLPIPADAQEAVTAYLNSALTNFVTTYAVRNQMLMRDLAYYRTNDQSEANNRAANANQSGDPSKLQNPVIPVVMPQVESAVAYAASVFLSGYPIFGVVTPPDAVDAGLAMETQLGENSIQAAWPLNLSECFRDGFKYNLGFVEVTWENKKLFSITSTDEKNISTGKAQETYYQGNTIKRLDPYNTFIDVRVPPEKNHERGEFAGYTELLGRIETKKRMEDLDSAGTMNFKAAFESACGLSPGASDITAAYYIPQVNPNALLPVQNQTQFSWLNWVNGNGKGRTGPNINYKDAYEWTVLYARILPSDFGIIGKGPNQVQIWKFIVINRQVVIFAERQTNAHNFLPILACCPTSTGNGWQNQSLAEVATPYQQIATALAISGIESQRRKVYDRVYYDPTKINKKDINDVSPVARIPVKASAYGKPIAESIYVSPYRDDGVAEVMQLSTLYADQADIANGQNRVQRGQFQKGNKTKVEFETVMGNSNLRQQLSCQYMEFSFMGPLKYIIKSNVLQYQPPAELMNSETGEKVTIDPGALRKALISFKLSDGMLPSDKLVSADAIQLLFQAAPSMPGLQAEYDLMGMFSYWMKLRGATWLNQFKYTDEQKQQKMDMMAQAAQAANPNPSTSGAQAPAAAQQALPSQG